MEMEPTAAWGPYEFQVANWNLEAPAAEVWAPTPVLPDNVEYTSIDIFGTWCSLQAEVPESMAWREQLVDHDDYYYYVDLKQNSVLQSGVQETSGSGRRGGTNAVNGGQDRVEPVVAPINKFTSDDLLLPEERELKDDIDRMKKKMHRYPASLRDSIDKRYIMPRIVAIGPYYSKADNIADLKQEKLKTVAVRQCIKEWGHSEEQLKDEIAPAVEKACSLYHKDVVAGIPSDDFGHMMMYDACFLVQFMFMYSRLNLKEAKRSELERFLRCKREDILHDLTLLENQLPWKVVQTVMRLVRVSEKDFVDSLGNWMQDHKIPSKQRGPFVWDGRYKPPHLLGLLRYYTVGRSPHDIISGEPKPIRRSVSTSVKELEKIGISLVPTKTPELIHMGLTQDGLLHGELSLAPVALNHNRASHLVNMAALELCTVERFSVKPQEDSAVCSYLRLLAMLAYREEDVQELRERGLLQGGGGLTDEDALRFFTSLQGLRLGRRYIGVMQQIERFKENRPLRTNCNVCWYNNKKTMAAYLGAFVSVATIVGTLVSIKTAL